MMKRRSTRLGTMFAATLMIGGMSYTQASTIMLTGSNNNANITTVLQGNGYTVVQNNNPSAGDLANVDSVILLRFNGNQAIIDFVNDGGGIITEFTGADWVLNTANMLDADKDGDVNGQQSDVNFTAAADAVGLNDGIGASYNGGGGTEFWRTITNIGGDVTVYAERNFDDGAAIIGGVYGDGGVLIMAYDWGDGFPADDTQDVAILLLNGLELVAPNYWTGMDDAIWSNDDNWSKEFAPDEGDGVRFAGSTNTTVDHDRAAGTIYSGITFRANASQFNITGNGLAIADGGAITNNSSSTQVIYVDVATEGDVTYNAASSPLVFLTSTHTIGNGHTLTVTGADDTTIYSNVTGDGALIKNGSGVLMLTGDNDWVGTTTINNGTFVAENVESGPGGHMIVNGGTLMGIGAIGGDLTANGGTIAPGNSIGTMAVGGTFTLDGGTLSIELNNAGQNDRIVADAAVLDSGTVHAIPTEVIQGAKTYTIVQTTNGVTIDHESINKTLEDDSFMLGFDLLVVGNDLRLRTLVEQNFESAAIPTGNPDMREIGRLLDNAVAGGHNSAAVTRMQNMNQRRLSQTLKQLQPDVGSAANHHIVRVQPTMVHNAAYTRVQNAQTAMRQQQVTRQNMRLASAQENGATELAAMQVQRDVIPGVGEWSIYGRSLNDWGRAQGDEFSSGYRWNNHGADVGLQTRVTENILLGGGVSAIWSGIYGRDSSGDAEVTTLYANINAAYITENWHVHGGFSYGHAWTEASRVISAMGVTADSDFESDIYSGFLGGGYIFDVHGWDLEPFAGVEYTHVVAEGYSETGAGALNLSISRDSTDSLRHSVGVRLARTFDLENDMRLRPRFSAAWEYEWLDTQISTNVDLLGTTFVNRGIDFSRHTARIGAGADLHLSRQVQLFADYTASINHDWHSHAANVGIRFTF